VLPLSSAPTPKDRALDQLAQIRHRQTLGSTEVDATGAKHTKSAQDNELPRQRSSAAVSQRVDAAGYRLLHRRYIEP
jgi:hypothetical protein